ncbi:MAG: hypothetical protein AAGF78_00750 [Pseudomonadota bacterium]
MFKNFAIAATAIALTAGAASANNSFGILGGIESGDTYYDVTVARTNAGGTVQIESFAGDVLGMASLNEGTNTDVRIDFDTPAAKQPLVAKLIVNGVVVDEDRIVVKR